MATRNSTAGCGSSLFDMAAKSLTFQAVYSYYSSHGRDQIATLRGMAGLHHRSLKAHLICLDFPARRKKFPVPDHREFVAITGRWCTNRRENWPIAPIPAVLSAQSATFSA
jgi:hypothetical protein